MIENTTQQTEEQLDLFYQPLQDKLLWRYKEYVEYARIVYDDNIMNYLEWLEFNLNEINEEIKELQ
jgi:hypothetical protein